MEIFKAMLRQGAVPNAINNSVVTSTLEKGKCPEKVLEVFEAT